MTKNFVTGDVTALDAEVYRKNLKNKLIKIRSQWEAGKDLAFTFLAVKKIDPRYNKINTSNTLEWLKNQFASEAKQGGVVHNDYSGKFKEWGDIIWDPRSDDKNPELVKKHNGMKLWEILEKMFEKDAVEAEKFYLSSDVKFDWLSNTNYWSSYYDAQMNSNLRISILKKIFSKLSQKTKEDMILKNFHPGWISQTNHLTRNTIMKTYLNTFYMNAFEHLSINNSWRTENDVIYKTKVLWLEPLLHETLEKVTDEDNILDFVLLAIDNHFNPKTSIPENIKKLLSSDEVIIKLKLKMESLHEKRNFTFDESWFIDFLSKLWVKWSETTLDATINKKSLLIDVSTQKIETEEMAKLIKKYGLEWALDKLPSEFKTNSTINKNLEFFGKVLCDMEGLYGDDYKKSLHVQKRVKYINWWKKNESISIDILDNFVEVNSFYNLMHLFVLFDDKTIEINVSSFIKKVVNISKRSLNKISYAPKEIQTELKKLLEYKLSEDDCLNLLDIPSLDSELIRDIYTKSASQKVFDKIASQSEKQSFFKLLQSKKFMNDELFKKYFENDVFSYEYAPWREEYIKKLLLLKDTDKELYKNELKNFLHNTAHDVPYEKQDFFNWHRSFLMDKWAFMDALWDDLIEEFPLELRKIFIATSWYWTKNWLYSYNFPKEKRSKFILKLMELVNSVEEYEKFIVMLKDYPENPVSAHLKHILLWEDSRKFVDKPSNDPFPKTHKLDTLTLSVYKAALQKDSSFGEEYMPKVVSDPSLPYISKIVEFSNQLEAIKKRAEEEKQQWLKNNEKNIQDIDKWLVDIDYKDWEKIYKGDGQKFVVCVWEDSVPVILSYDMSYHSWIVYKVFNKNDEKNDKKLSVVLWGGYMVMNKDKKTMYFHRSSESYGSVSKDVQSTMKKVLEKKYPEYTINGLG